MDTYVEESKSSRADSIRSCIDNIKDILKNHKEMIGIGKFAVIPSGKIFLMRDDELGEREYQILSEAVERINSSGTDQGSKYRFEGRFSFGEPIQLGLFAKPVIPRQVQ